MTKPKGKPPDPLKIIRTLRTTGLFWNDQTGNLHRTVKVMVFRANGHVDHGDPLVPAGHVPMHPTTGEPLADSPGNRGLKINPKPAGTVVKGTVVIHDKTYDGHGKLVLQTYINVARYAWWRQTGERLDPRIKLRHVDGDLWNNHISNLQIVRKAVGVSRKRPWQAVTRVSGARVSLGYHQTREAAVEAVNAFRTAAGLDPVRPYARQTVTTADQSATFAGEE